MTQHSVELQVLEPEPIDVSKLVEKILRRLGIYPSYENKIDSDEPIICLDPDTCLQLKIAPGDKVIVSGDTEVTATVRRAEHRDWNKHKTIANEPTLLGADVELGDWVVIRPSPKRANQE